MRRAIIAFVLVALIGCAPKEDPPVAAPTASAPQQDLIPEVPQQDLLPTVEESKQVDLSPFVGAWSGRYESAGASNAVSSKESTQITGMLESYQATLDLREDGTYRLLAMVGAKPIEDTWETDGETVVLTSSGPDENRRTSTELGTPNGLELTLTVGADGTLIGPSPIRMGEGTMVYRRK